MVQGKLAGLIVRAPVEGLVTALDRKVGEHRNPGERLAEVTPDSGMKLPADVDEFYLATGSSGPVRHRRDRRQRQVKVNVRRVSPQVRNGQFTIDLDFEGESLPAIVAGETTQRAECSLGGDTPRPASVHWRVLELHRGRLGLRGFEKTATPPSAARSKWARRTMEQLGNSERARNRRARRDIRLHESRIASIESCSLE